MSSKNSSDKQTPEQKKPQEESGGPSKRKYMFVGTRRSRRTRAGHLKRR